MLKPPHWAKNAIPTPRGWVDPRTGELLVSRKLSDRQITEYFGVNQKSEPITEVKPLIEADPVLEEVSVTAEPLIEADPVLEEVSTLSEPLVEDYESYTKAQLVEIAEQKFGVNIPSTRSKSSIVAELNNLESLSQ